MSELQVHVTQEDIDTGEQGDCRECAVAKAFQRCPDVHSVDVGFQSVWWDSSSKVPMRADLPEVARDFIKNFDMKSSRPLCKPFSFTVTPSERR